LEKTCSRGGWNYGNPGVLGVDADPYPETTGVGLLALAGTKSEKLDRTLDAAERWVREVTPYESLHWLSLGLLAHGRTPQAVGTPARNVRGVALALIHEAAWNGNHVLLS
jgi:hypothetical protein